MNSLKGKTVVITGASRGIGLAIALRFAREQANIVIASKEEPTINLQKIGDQIEEAGGKALALNIDVGNQSALKQAAAQTVSYFGGIDILVNNTSATHFTGTLHTSPEKFDLLIATSVRAAFLLSQASLPYLQKAQHPHIINISPPMDLDPKWFKDHLPFSIGKYGMSLCTLGMAAEFKGVSINSLWPQTTIATATIKEHFVPKVYTSSRWPTIMADAAYALVQRTCTGQFFTDEALLREEGVTDFSKYAVDPTAPLMQALFVSENQTIPLTQDLYL